LTQTAMSNPDLPPEILDYIIDLLHDEPETLKRCCLVSKSWVPRTRKHLFADIGFQTEEHLKSMEGDVSGSINISCALRQNSIRWLLPGRRGCRCGSG
jgi:hypothetical protein